MKINIKKEHLKLTPHDLEVKKEVKKEVYGKDWELEDKKRCGIAVKSDQDMVNHIYIS